MYEDNILKRYPRHDTDFLWSDPSPRWNEHSGELVIPWTHTALTFLWIVVLVAAILWICAHSSVCPCYHWLIKLRQPQPRSEYSNNWANNRVLVQEERNQPTPPPAALLADTRGGQAQRFDDPPPDYFQVVKSDLPPYPLTSTTATQSPNPEWTGRPLIDNRNINI